VLDGGSKLAAAVTAFANELNGGPLQEPSPSGSRAVRPRFGVLRWMTS